MSGSNSSPPDEKSTEVGHPQPLTLTVHDLPLATQAQGREAPDTRRGRWTLLLLFLLSASPVIASYFTYYVVRPQSCHAYGELIEPQRPLPDWQATDRQGQPLAMTTLRHQWLLISVSQGPCEASCEHRLYLQRQLREGLGKEKDKLDWVWLRTQGEVPEALRAGVAAATVLKVPENELARWLEPAPGHQLQDHLYVVDPMGNWMMRFPADAKPKQIKRDLDRLLRAAAFWDQPGRPSLAKDGRP